MVTFDIELPSLETCNKVTHNCECQCVNEPEEDTDILVVDSGCQQQTLSPGDPPPEAATSLRIFTWELNCLRIQQHTAAFEAATGVAVTIDCIRAPKTRDEFHDEILSDARLQTGLYDGYTLGPHLFGDLDLLEGLHDLTQYVRDSGSVLAWNDIFLFNREMGAVYDRKIVGIPIDGDVHSLYYRIDLFEKYNKTPPATWEEYTELAKFFNGRFEPLPGTATTGNATSTSDDNIVQISGSCVGRRERTEYWTFLILSSMTQYAGTSTGALFDPRNGNDMEPLLGEAFVKTLQFMEEQFVYGADNEYDGSFKDVNLDRMNEGRCAMTYMWGDAYTEGAKSPPASVVSGYMGTVHTPGSKVYLNRDTQKLEPCTENICSCGNIHFEGHENDSCINSAPYAAYTGWSGACSNFTAPAQKKACADFFSFISSPVTSVADTIPNVTVGASAGEEFIAVDPYRTSQTILADWIERGLPENSTRMYLDTIKSQHSDTNVVLDMRIPASVSFLSEMNAVFRDHLTILQNKRLAGMEGEELLSTDDARWEVERDIRSRWRAIITEYDKVQPSTLLEAYQRNLGVYIPPENVDSGLEAWPIIAIAAAFAVIVVAVVIWVKRDNAKKNDGLWKIKRNELKFGTPPEIVGRGRFGLVLLAEYRGTEVAVKRVLPPSEKRQRHTMSTGGGSDENKIRETMSQWFTDDVESASSPSSLFSGAALKSVVREDTLGTSSDTFANDSSGNRRRLKKEFIQEMRLLATLRHPCIATSVGAVINSKEEPMLVMEYMHHGSLYDILHNDTMILEGAMLLQILRDISQGCRFLHAINPPVIHRDLAAKNILVDNRYRAKVADFGLSKKGRATGTPFWMAPELLSNSTPNTTSSDVYAFGITLYEMFARKDPYEGEDPVGVLKLVCDPAVNKRPVMPSDCPSQLRALMSDCVVADPEERPSFEEVDKRLKRVDVKNVKITQSPSKIGFKDSAVSLNDIFPQHIAEALRDGRPVEAEHRDIVTIFFSDIVGFTDISGSLEARKVANMLGRLYDKLDALSNKHDIFKVETIGDAYMAVTNLVRDQPNDHAKRIAEFAIEAIAAANNTYIDTDDPSRGVLNIRVGFHSGPVVADVVGSLNPRYCLFGDTVNTSSRMESNSLVNRIHCSERSAELLRMQDPNIPVTTRGLINVKGKGEMLTFWVNEPEGVPNSSVL